MPLLKRHLIAGTFASLLLSCQPSTQEYASFADYPAPVATNLWLSYAPQSTTFRLWSPVAEEVRLNFYEKGNGGEAYKTSSLKAAEQGVWSITIEGDLDGVYYTYQVKTNGHWLNETPGIYATAVGVNGQRAMVLNMQRTNPEGWDEDKRPPLTKPNEAILYELHIRDLTIHPGSGSNHAGKYSGLVETGTTSSDNLLTGIDHMNELGITHVHLLPTYDHYSIDETKLDSPQFNWGYDPQNYNVPEGSFSKDPFTAETRIMEFKNMVKAFHDAGIGVILDVVYNHTGRTEQANFNQEAPGYYYRQWDDGRWSDASACGNETASDRPMMRKFILESILYWAREYHLDGFRFDLMGIHDMETMNEIASEVKKIDPSIFIYGEGWTAGDSPLPFEKRALKMNTHHMPLISAFSDDIRDGLKGSVFEDLETGFVSGASGKEESIKFGVVGSIQHDQIDYKAVNYSDAPWAQEPWQAVSYVSCHDNHTLYDKLKISRQDASEAEIKAMHKLANAVVLTSQGIPFLHAGVEMMRTKFGEHNSFESPDSINQIDWSRKKEYYDVFTYYRQLIDLRKNHPAFFMPDADMVRKHLRFGDSQPGVVSFTISDHANGDRWKDIMVIYNATTQAKTLMADGTWTIVASGNTINEKGIMKMTKSLTVPPQSMMMGYRE
jgi:pullulanase